MCLASTRVALKRHVVLQCHPVVSHRTFLWAPKTLSAGNGVISWRGFPLLAVSNLMTARVIPRLTWFPSGMLSYANFRRSRSTVSCIPAVARPVSASYRALSLWYFAQCIVRGLRGNGSVKFPEPP